MIRALYRKVHGWFLDWHLEWKLARYKIRELNVYRSRLSDECFTPPPLYRWHWVTADGLEIMDPKMTEEKPPGRYVKAIKPHVSVAVYDIRTMNPGPTGKSRTYQLDRMESGGYLENVNGWPTHVTDCYLHEKYEGGA